MESDKFHKEGYEEKQGKSHSTVIGKRVTLPVIEESRHGRHESELLTFER